MKIIQIEKLLNGVIDKLRDNIDDVTVSSIINSGYITGGCIPSMILGEWVNDYDVYFYSPAAVSIIKEYFNQPKNRIQTPEIVNTAFITDNAITLPKHKVQLITKYFGPPEKVIEKFDWAHIKSWYDIEDKRTHLCPNLHQLLIEKELIYTGSEYPLSSLLRTRKFIKKGWHISTSNMVHIVLDIMQIFHNSEKIEKLHQFKQTEEQYNELIEEDNDIEIAPGMPPFPEEIEPIKISVKTLIDQLNGVDPLTVQSQLQRVTGQSLTISEIIKILES